MDAKLDLSIQLLVSASRHLAEVHAMLGGDYYDMLRDPIKSKNTATVPPRRFFPWHRRKSWKSVVIALNDHGEAGRRYRIMHAMLVAMDVPVWDFISDTWQHRENRRRFGTTNLAKEADEQFATQKRANRQSEKNQKSS